MEEEIVVNKKDILKLIELVKLQTKASESLKRSHDRDAVEITQRAIMSIQKDIKNLVPIF